jgi:RNA polymerase sigma-70 factor, ECF subfamily
VPTTANGQPAFAIYERSDAGHSGADARWAAHSIHVLTFEDDTISAMTLFVSPADTSLFETFGLPLSLPSTPQHV